MPLARYASHNSRRRAALFLPVESPGQVLRFLEWCGRHAAMPPPGGLLLSDAVGPLHLRALTAGENTHVREWMEASGAAFATAIGETVTLVFVDDKRWGWRIWQPGTDEEPEAFTATVEPLSLVRRLQRRALGQPPDTASERARVWMEGRGLPVDRVPGWARKPPPIVDYDTVSQLDRRGLLVEREPRLYRFVVGTAGEDAAI